MDNQTLLDLYTRQLNNNNIQINNLFGIQRDILNNINTINRDNRNNRNRNNRNRNNNNRMGTNTIIHPPVHQTPINQTPVHQTPVHQTVNPNNFLNVIRTFYDNVPIVP